MMQHFVQEFNALNSILYMLPLSVYLLVVSVYSVVGITKNIYFIAVKSNHHHHHLILRSI